MKCEIINGLILQPQHDMSVLERASAPKPGLINVIMRGQCATKLMLSIILAARNFKPHHQLLSGNF